MDAGMTVTVVARRMFGSWANACEAAGVIAASEQKTKHQKCTVDGCDGKPRSGRSVYCEMHYGRIRRTGTLETTQDTNYYDACVYCDKPSSGLKFCDARCRARHNRGNPRFKQCVMCGSTYEPLNDGIDPVTCSEACDIGKTRHYQAVRRGAKRAERFTVVSIMDRDGWVCGICGDPVSKDLKWPHPMSASLDHIVPVSKGGPHTRLNTQCSHLTCNQKKSAKMPEAA